MTIALRLHRMGKQFDAGVQSCRARVTALHDIDLELAFDEVVAVTGPSGCGKSTLLRCAAGLLEPTTGSVFRAGRVVTITGIRGSRDVAIVGAHDRDARPAIVICDDPVAGIDPPTSAELGRWLRRIREAGHAVLVSARDRRDVARTGARIVTLERGGMLVPDDRSEAPRHARIAERDTRPREY